MQDDLRTIDVLEAGGFTHIEARCSCGKATQIPFRMLRERKKIWSDTKIADLASRLKCETCGRPPSSWRAWYIGLDKVDGTLHGSTWGVMPLRD